MTHAPTEFQAGIDCGVIFAARYMLEQEGESDYAQRILFEASIESLAALEATRATPEDIEVLKGLFDGR